MLVKFVLVFVSVLAPFVSSYEANVESRLNGFIINPRDINTPLSPRLIGGVEVTPHAFPFQTALMIYKGSSIYFCGGSLITNQWVLTAAHCVDMKPDYILVVLGAHNLTNLDTNVQVVNATQTKFHSDWNEKTLINDVGLVRLPTNATLNSYVKTVQLASGTDKYVGQTATTLGWGQTETEELSYVLKEVNATIMDNDACANANSNYKDVVKATHVCTAGTGPKGSCSGDSGGPLLVNGTQVGIVSFGTTDCTLGLPSVFTRITDYYDWIQKNAVDGGGGGGGNGASGPDSLRFVAIVSAALCVLRLFKSM